MKQIFLLLAALSLMAGEVHAQPIDYKALNQLTEKFIMTVQVGKPGTPDFRFVYVNARGRLFVYRVEKGSFVQEWQTTDLGSRAASMFVTDIDADGTLDLVVGTIGGRILDYAMGSYDLIWENLQDRFKKIEYIAHANIDDDPQEEMIILADDLMYIYDGRNKTIEWVSDTQFHADMVILGNVDDDPQLEIILNTGRVVDSRFHNIEFEADGKFGDRIHLFDINGDGYPDVFGEFNDFSIRVYDVWAQRELW